MVPCPLPSLPQSGSSASVVSPACCLGAQVISDLVVSYDPQVCVELCLCKQERWCSLFKYNGLVSVHSWGQTLGIWRLSLSFRSNLIICTQTQAVLPSGPSILLPPALPQAPQLTRPCLCMLPIHRLCRTLRGDSRVTGCSLD